MTSIRQLAVLGLAVLAGLTGTALAGRPPARIVSGSVRVPPGRTASLSISCPAGTVAASGGVVDAHVRIKTIRARPTGTRTWQFRFLSAGHSAENVAGSAVCLKRGRVATVRRSITSRSRANVVLRCRAGMTPVGLGWSEVPRRKARSAHAGWALKSAVAGKRAWRVTARDLLHQSKKPSGRLKLYGRCISHTVVQRERFAAKVVPGENVLIRPCSTGRGAIGGGFTVGHRELFGGLSITSAFSGRWLVYNPSRAGKISLSLFCLKS
jgi:hypothetical protein